MTAGRRAGGLVGVPRTVAAAGPAALAPLPRRPRQGDGDPYLLERNEISVVNAALHLRRPLLVTGSPGTGKSSLARAVAHELGWARCCAGPSTAAPPCRTRSTVTTRSGGCASGTLGRDRGEAEPDIGSFVRLGPLGTALVPGDRPRALLVDELDKGESTCPTTC